MHLGKRKVRSAGRTSGSVEITLPVEVQSLQNVECDIILRDGVRPELVLQPDTSMVQAFFIELWQMLRGAFGEIGDIGDFSLADFSVGLLPPRHWSDKPPLSYADAFQFHVLICNDAPAQFVHGNAAFFSMLSSLATSAAYHVGLGHRLAVVFGDAVAFLITGGSEGQGTDFERSVAVRVFGAGERVVPGQIPTLSIDVEWEGAQQGFKRLYDQFVAWKENPEECEAARREWWLSIRTESAVTVSSVENYLRHSQLTT